MSDQKGLYDKYMVIKVVDGTVIENCFILRPDKDPAAVKALQAYAAATENKVLAADLFAWVGKPMQKPMTLDELFPGGIERSPDVMWIEFKEQHSLDVWKPAYSGEDFVYWFNQINYEKDRYNKTWRCWISKPTDEERAAAPWEE